MNSFDTAIKSLPSKISQMLDMIDKQIKSDTWDICLNVNQPIMLSQKDCIWFVGKEKNLSAIYDRSFYHLTSDDINECIRSLTHYSLHSAKSQLDNGFITVQGGHRAGVCGSYTLDNSTNNFFIKEYSSITLRIARQVTGVAKTLCTDLFTDKLSSVLIVGPPSCGKTTLLRDIAYNLANKSINSKYIKTSVIDTRCEIGAVYNGTPSFNLGVTCNIFSGYPKDFGVKTALKTMSPQVIIFDEIGSMDEFYAVKDCLNAGVCVITSAHAYSVEQALKRDFIKFSIEQGCFDYIVSITQNCEISSIKKVV